MGIFMFKHRETHTQLESNTSFGYLEIRKCVRVILRALIRKGGRQGGREVGMTGF